MTARRSARWALLTLGVTTVLEAGPLRAEDVSPLAPAGQESLARAIQFWLGSAPTTDSGARVAPKVTAAGDHYRVQLSAAGLPNLGAYSEVEGGDFSFDARPEGDTAWRFDNFDGKPLTVAMGETPQVKLGLRFEGAQWHVRMDPALVSPSTVDNRVESSTAHVDIAGTNRLGITTGPVVVRETWQPSDAGRFDRVQHAAVEQLAVTSEATPADRAVRFTARLFTGDGRFLGVSPDAMARLNARMRALAQQAPPITDGKLAGDASPTKQAGTQQDAPPSPPPPAADNAPGAPTPTDQQPPAKAVDIAPPAGAKPDGEFSPRQRALLRELLAGIGDAAKGLDVTIALDDVAVAVGAQAGRLRHVEFSEGAQAVADGKVNAHLRMAVDGLDVPGLPPAFRAYVPGRFVLAPRVTGVPGEPLRRLLEAALAGDKPDRPAVDAAWRDMQEAGPVEVHIDDLALTVGPAALHCTGALTTSGHAPTTATGAADIDATGFDALIRQLSATPLLKQAAPILIFIKGIGDQQPDGRLHWRVAFDGRHATVNGTDLSQLMPR